MVDNAQTALAWALKLGVYDTDEQQAFMAAKLVESIQNTDGTIREGYAENTLEVGFPGVNVLLPATSESGWQSRWMHYVMCWHSSSKCDEPKECLAHDRKKDSLYHAASDVAHTVAVVRLKAEAQI